MEAYIYELHYEAKLKHNVGVTKRIGCAGFHLTGGHIMKWNMSGLCSLCLTSVQMWAACSMRHRWAPMIRLTSPVIWYESRDRDLSHRLLDMCVPPVADTHGSIRFSLGMAFDVISFLLLVRPVPDLPGKDSRIIKLIDNNQEHVLILSFTYVLVLCLKLKCHKMLPKPCLNRQVVQ